MSTHMQHHTKSSIPFKFYINTLKKPQTSTQEIKQVVTNQRRAMAVAKLGFMICLVLLLSTNTIVSTSAQCQGNFQGLVQECSKYVQKPGPRQSPSPSCCNVIRNVDLPCVCQHVTSQVEKIISMEKAAFVTASCGKPLAHGTKCGSKKLIITNTI